MSENATEAWVEQAYNDILEEGFVYDDTRLDPDALDDERVDFLLNRMAAWEDEKARRKAAYEAETRRLDGMISWFKLRFTAKLEVYLANKLAGDKKRKSITLPCGVRLAKRQVKGDILFLNKDGFLDWARDNAPELHTYKMVEEVDKPFALRYMEEGKLVSNDDGTVLDASTGEVVPGAAWRPTQDNFYIQIPKTAAKKGSATEVDEDADLLQ